MLLRSLSPVGKQTNQRVINLVIELDHKLKIGSGVIVRTTEFIAVVSERLIG